MKYWEIIADNLHNAGWSLGWVSVVDNEARTIWIVDAHGAGEKLMAFIEMELAIRICSEFH